MYGNSFLHMTVYVNFQVVMEIYNPLGQVTDAWVRLPVNGTIYDVFSPTGDTIPYQVIDEAYVTTYFTGFTQEILLLFYLGKMLGESGV